MSGKFFLVAILSLTIRQLPAQEFWMMPDKFYYEKGDTIRIRFNVGENFVGETWNLRQERIRTLSLHTGTSVADLKPQAQAGRTAHLKIPATREGTYLITMEGENAFVELPAERFNAYLKEHALDNVATLREKANATDKPGREMYRRISKLMVHVGQEVDDGYKKVAGLPLEIIPGKHPSTMKKGDLVQFKILFNGKPEFGARVYVWNNKNNKIFNQPVYSQQDGTIDVRIFNDGDWMVSVVKMIPVSNPKAEWQSFWSSLVFHVRE